MSWLPPIRCVGRTYPNAPSYARSGWPARPPSYWLCVIGNFHGPYTPFKAAIVPHRWRRWNPLAGFDVSNEWEWQGEGLGDNRTRSFVFTQLAAGVWTLYVTLHGWQFGGFSLIRYRKEFPGGFPEVVPDTFTLTYWFDTGFPYGKPATIRVFNLKYNMLLGGSCVP
jgi:hypothetical protein